MEKTTKYKDSYRLLLFLRQVVLRELFPIATRCSRRRHTQPWCRHLANWSKHTRRLWFGHPPLHGNRTSSKKTGSTLRIALPSKDQATATSKNYTVGKFGCMGFDISEQTNKQTKTLITILRTPTGVEKASKKSVFLSRRPLTSLTAFCNNSLMYLM